MNLLESYKEAKKHIATIKDEKKQVNDLVYKIKNLYQKKISDLKSEMNTEIHRAEIKAEEKTSKMDAAKAVYEGTILKVKNILNIMHIIKEGNTASQPEVYVYSNKDEQGNYLSEKRKVFIAPIESLREDKYSIFNLYIVPNGKPVNAYSLIIRGYTIFGDLIEEHAHGYVTGVGENCCNFYATLKEAPFIESLLAYVAKPQNMKKIKKVLPKRLDTLIEEYQEAGELLKDIKWQIKYLESRKYYYENCYFRGDETPEYKQIIKDLKKLKSN